MLKINNTQKEGIESLRKSNHQHWTKNKIIKALQIIYGKKISVLELGVINGQQTKIKVQCNLCSYGSKEDGTQWITTFRNLLFHPSCPRCAFCGKCHKLGYTIVQQRLDKKHQHIIIKALHNHLYKSRRTKVIAYNSITHQKIIASIDNLLRNRTRIQKRNVKGKVKKTDRRSFDDYAKEINKKWNNIVKVYPLEYFKNQSKSKILAINTKSGNKHIVTFKKLLQRKNPVK